MIISASRRTDIPAFFGDWLLNRLDAGYVLVRNPMRFHQVSRISLDRESVDAFVFWTKDAEPFFPTLDVLLERSFRCYFQYTLNDYPISIEQALPSLDERIKTMRALSRRLGAHCMTWRYDPIIFTDEIGSGQHLMSFERLCDALDGAVTECTFTFVVNYLKTRRHMKGQPIVVPGRAERVDLIGNMARVAHEHGIVLQACCEDDFSECGVQPAACISQQRIERICGHAIAGRKDSGQRRACRCIQSVDIGSYDSCAHGCIYCYANSSMEKIRSNLRDFDLHSEILGHPLGEDDRAILRDNPSNGRPAKQPYTPRKATADTQNNKRYNGVIDSNLTELGDRDEQKF